MRQNLLLPHQIQGLISKGKAEGLKQIAGWLNMNHRRLNHHESFVARTEDSRRNHLLQKRNHLRNPRIQTARRRLRTTRCYH